MMTFWIGTFRCYRSDDGYLSRELRSRQVFEVIAVEMVIKDSIGTSWCIKMFGRETAGMMTFAPSACKTPNVWSRQPQNPVLIQCAESLFWWFYGRNSQKILYIREFYKRNISNKLHFPCYNLHKLTHFACYNDYIKNANYKKTIKRYKMQW